MKKAISLLLAIVAACNFLTSCVTVSSGGGSTQKSVLAKEMDLSAEQEEAILEIFQRCGIGEIKSATLFKKGESESSYYLDDEETAVYKGVDNTIVVWIYNDTKTVKAIYFHDNDIYVDNEVVAQVTDYYVNSEDQSKYRVESQLAINQLLNYPDTAEYPAKSGWAFGIKDGIVIVQSTVTAKNAFGVEITNKFQVKFDNGKIVSLILDGQEYIN